MSQLQFYRAILSCNFIAQQSHSMQLCMAHTATLSHKQELTNERSPHFRDKVAQNRASSEKELREWLLQSCATRHVTLAILSRDKVARQSCAIKLQV